jgi:hypothetical protein
MALNIRNNKADLTTGSGALVATSNQLIFQAAEIDLAVYTAFAGAIAPCFVGGCQTETIRGFFQVERPTQAVGFTFDISLSGLLGRK